MGNKNLIAAKSAKNDEFYTQYSDIETEINAYVEYNPDVFRGKTILLPCDDYEWSNFTRYFVANFERLGLKKLISTSYANGHGKLFVLSKDNDDSKIELAGYLEGDGDFRSAEVTTLRDEADIIITNPPFSLFREFLAWIMDGKKKFVIIGNKNAIIYKEVFPLIKNNQAWLGNCVPVEFILPDGTVTRKVQGLTRWFTNIDHGGRHEKLLLMTMRENLKYNRKLKEKLEKDYGKLEYPHYDNYDAIEIPYTECIPSDYDGVMGVPISFLDKYCPEQFEIVWQASGNAYANAPREIMEELGFDPAVKYGGGLGVAIANGQAKYSRILIRHNN